MEDANDFIEHYRPKLLFYLDAKKPAGEEQLGPLEFVEEILDSWSKFAAGRKLGEPSQLERTFWFALYEFENLVEVPASGQLDPYEGLLMQHLADARELLRNGKGLPDGLYATRPGE